MSLHPTDHDSQLRVAVVGAGISGLICAKRLQNHGFEVTVFEKSRSVSGRAATRRGEPQLSFDHGAQYFTVCDSAFAQSVEKWVQLGEKLNEIAPFKEEALAFMTNSGAEAVEAAIKLVKTATGRSGMISFQGGYHGQTHGALALMGNLGPKVPGLMPEMEFHP